MAFPLIGAGLIKAGGGILGKVIQGVRNVKAAKAANRAQASSFMPPMQQPASLVAPVQGGQGAQSRNIEVSTETADFKLGWQVPVALIVLFIVMKFK